LEYSDDYKYIFDNRNEDGYAADALDALWVKLGAGADYNLTQSAFIRAELLYGLRTANTYETDGIDKYEAENTRLGHGLTVKVGAGFRL